MNAVMGRAAWRGYADLLQAFGLDEATARGFTVRNGDVVSTVELPGGLTEEHYDFFAPVLLDEDRAELARGIILNMARSALGSDNTILQDHVLQGFGPDLLDSLPALIESQGAEGVAAIIEDKVAAYRNERPRLSPLEPVYIFRRFQVGDRLFRHVRFVYDDDVEEAKVEENTGMFYLGWFLQSLKPVTIDGVMLYAKGNPPPQRKKDQGEMGDEEQHRSRYSDDHSQARLEALTAAQLDSVIERQQAEIERLTEGQNMIDWSDKDENELDRLQEMVRELKKMRRDDFTWKGRRRRGCTPDLRRAADRIDRNLRTCYSAMRKKGLVRFVGFLRRHIQRCGFSFRYLPPDPPIEWRF